MIIKEKFIGYKNENLSRSITVDLKDETFEYEKAFLVLKTGLEKHLVEITDILSYLVPESLLREKGIIEVQIMLQKGEQRKLSRIFTLTVEPSLYESGLEKIGDKEYYTKEEVDNMLKNITPILPDLKFSKDLVKKEYQFIFSLLERPPVFAFQGYYTYDEGGQGYIRNVLSTSGARVQYSPDNLENTLTYVQVEIPISNGDVINCDILNIDQETKEVTAKAKFYRNSVTPDHYSAKCMSSVELFEIEEE